MMNSIAYKDQVCPRCGSKQRVSKVWKEVIPTFSGSVEVDCSQIVCTNDACQTAFDKNLAHETKKKEELKQQKDEKDRLRKENAVISAKNARKS